MKFFWRLLLIFISGLTLIGTPVQAQSQAWFTPVQLSSERTSAWFPDIAADEYGMIHVVWSQATGNYDNVMYTSSVDGKTWLQANDIIAIPADRGSEATRPRIIADETTSDLHLLYRYNQVFFAEAPDLDAEKASAWSIKGMLSDVSQVAYFSDLAIDQAGTFHALVTWNVPTVNCEICYHVFYRQLLKGETDWTSAVDISRLDIGSAKPSILIDSQQNLHAIWEASDEGGGSYGAVHTPSYILYSRSTDGGLTWSEPRRMGEAEAEGHNPSLIQDRRGQLIVVGLALPTNDIFYQVSSNAGEDWSTPEILPGIVGGWDIYNTLLDRTSMAVDADGIVHLVLVGKVAGVADRLQVIHLSWDGANWSTPDVIVTYSGDAPEWARIIVSEGNKLNVVWFLRDSEHLWDTVNGKYTVWFSQLLTSASRIAPKIQPTRTPTLLTTDEPVIATLDSGQPVQMMTETPTIVVSITPAVPMDYIPGENAYYKETDYLKLIGMAAVPAALFLIIILAIIFWRRSKHR